MWKSRAVYAATVLCAVFLLSYYENPEIPYLFLYALLLLAGYAVLSILLAPRLLRLENYTEADHLFKNGVMRLDCRLRNKGIFPYPRLRCSYHSTGILNYGEGTLDNTAVPPRTTRKLSHQIHFPYRGIYSLGVSGAVATDFLGLFRIKIPESRAVTVAVYPLCDDTFRLPVRSEPLDTAPPYSSANEDITEVADVRRYMPTDSMKKVHWKLSAKRGELLVKNHPPYVPTSTLLFLDTSAMPLEGAACAGLEDEMASCAASAINYCMKSRLSAQFVFGEGEGEQLQVDAFHSMDKVLRLLAGLEFGRQESALPAFTSLVEQKSGNVNMVLLLWRLDGITAELLGRYIGADHNVVVYFFSSEALPTGKETLYLLEGLRARGAQVFMQQAAMPEAVS